MFVPLGAFRNDRLTGASFIIDLCAKRFKTSRMPEQAEFFKIECPKCHQAIECPNQLYEQTVTCPTCSEQIQAIPCAIPAPEQVQAVPPAIPSQNERPKPPLWNVFARAKYHREQREIQQAKQREERGNYIASVLDAIRRGEWALRVENVVLTRDEKVLWSEPGTLYEWQTVGRHYESTLFSARGKKVTEKAEVAVAGGSFIITDQRLIFSSGEKSFSVKPEKLLNIHLFPDGIRFSEDRRQKPRAIKFQRRNGDIMQAILNQTFASTN